LEEALCRPLDEIDEDLYMDADEAKAKRTALLKQEFTSRCLHQSHSCDVETYLGLSEAARMVLMIEPRSFVDPLDATCELCEGGADMVVDLSNVRQYVELVKHHWLDEGVRLHVQAFREGVSDFFPAEALLPFTPRELRAMICGEESQRWTESELKRFLRPSSNGSGGGAPKFTHHHSTYQYLVCSGAAICYSVLCSLMCAPFPDRGAHGRKLRTAACFPQFCDECTPQAAFDHHRGESREPRRQKDG
jgi:hypothetical protein